MVRQAVPLQPKVVQCGTEIRLQLHALDAQRRLGPPGKTMLEQVPCRTCRPMQSEVHTKKGLLAGLMSHGGSTPEQLVPEELHPEEGCSIL